MAKEKEKVSAFIGTPLSAAEDLLYRLQSYAPHGSELKCDVAAWLWSRVALSKADWYSFMEALGVERVPKPGGGWKVVPKETKAGA